MAEMIPDRPPTGATAGEKRVFAALAPLPNDCLVYYEPMVRRRYPDFIVILPSIGVLVIEVKDWRLAELDSVNADTVAITRRDSPTVFQNPHRQARDYMFRLMNECKMHPRADMVVHEEGRHAGRFIFPFAHIAVLSNIPRTQIDESPDVARLFPPHTTIARDELAAWETRGPDALLARLKACFDPWWPFPKLTPARVDVLRGAIHPEIIIRAGEIDLAVLDLRQERNALAIGDGGQTARRRGQDPADAWRRRPAVPHRHIAVDRSVALAVQRSWRRHRARPPLCRHDASRGVARGPAFGQFALY
jgi:hypothetical protein